MDEKNKDYLDYLTLSPTSDAQDIEEYSDNLDYCLKKDDILNIAVSGIYGSGKSSFIKTFFSKNRDYNTITISLGNYENGKTKKIEGQENEYYQSIEKSILQQLLYQVDENAVPLSRFKRINKYSKVKLFIQSSIFIILFVLSIFVLFPVCIEKLQNNLSTLENFLSFIPSIKLFKINFNTSKILTFFIFLCVIGFLMYIFYKVIEFLKNKISISKFKFKDAEIEINNKSESIFNKYLDEIIYFFQSTNFNVVVIEDLDRFEDSTFIIQKLKELNQLINSSTKMTSKVKFVFAIKDDFFTDPKERTKFFDKIIPIIPISSYTNSNEIIWEKFEKIYGKKKKYGDITKKFIDDVSIFVDDMRSINNIISEFIIYHDKFIKKNLDDKKLFAMIMYKNLYPKEYSDLLLGLGTIPTTFNNIGLNINKQITEINKEIENLKKEKAKVGNEELQNISELKYIFISNLLNYNVSYNEQYLLFNNQKVKISNFLNDDFDINKFSNESVKFECDSYPRKTLNEEETFQFFGNKENFMSRLKTLNVTKEKRIEQLQSKIELNTIKIKTIKEKSLKELISIYGASDFIETKNDYEIFSLSRGYITNDYNDYISIFKEGNLKNADMRFIKSVKKNEKLEYSYHLESLEEIVSRLDPMDYANINVLNIDLIDFLVKNKEKYSRELEKILLLFTDINDENYEFIEQYEKSENEIEYFLKQIILQSNNLWQYLYENKIGNKDYIDRWILRYLKYPDSFNKIDSRFIAYVNNHQEFFNIESKELMLNLINSLKKLNIKFNNINPLTDDDLIDEIYKNNLYELNIHMITILLKKFDIDFKDVSEKLITTIYETKELELMKSYIEDNFSDFFNNCYLKGQTFNNDENSLIEILNSSLIKLEEKEKVIEKEKGKFNKIELIDNELYDILIKYNKLEYNLENILELYREKEKLSTEIINIINSNKINFDNLLNISNKEIVKKFEYDFSINNDILISIYKDGIKRFNTIGNFNNNELENNRLQILIENDIIQFNVSNFNYIKANYNTLIYKFIDNSVEQFKENIEEYDISDMDILTSKDINNSLKQYLIDERIIDPLEIDLKDLYVLLIEKSIYIDNSELDKKIMESSISKEQKIKYLLQISSKLNIDKLLEYIKLIGTDYKYISSNFQSANIDYNLDTLKLLEVLKTNGKISSYKIGKRNNIIVYNKR